VGGLVWSEISPAQGGHIGPELACPFAILPSEPPCRPLGGVRGSFARWATIWGRPPDPCRWLRSGKPSRARLRSRSPQAPGVRAADRGRV